MQLVNVSLFTRFASLIIAFTLWVSIFHSSAFDVSFTGTRYLSEVKASSLLTESQYSQMVLFNLDQYLIPACLVLNKVISLTFQIYI